MKKLVRLIMMLLVLLSTASEISNRVAAAETDTITFILHKLVFPENGMPEAVPNDGDERLKDYDGLNGVTFDVYDVTEDFYRLLNSPDGKDAKEVQAELQNMDVSKRTSIAQQVTATLGDKEGIATFILPKLSKEKEAVYLFREGDAPSDVKSKAADMIVALPVLDAAGEIHEGPIHLYPKNEIVQPHFEKKILDQQTSYQLGDPIQYSLTTQVPSNLSMYSKYSISDQADKSLLLDAKSIKIQVADKVYAGYQLESSDHGFKLIFDLAKLKEHTGKTVSVSYTMTLQGTAKIDHEIINHAELETDFDKIVRERQIKTGGKKFIKVDALKKDQTLSGAVFTVKNAKGQYLQESEKTYRWTERKETAGVVKLTSNKEGFFEIKGLRYGNYSLEEVVAPTEYLLSEKDIPFEVSENSYSFSKGILQVVNQKASSTKKQSDKSSPIQTKRQTAAGSLAQYPKMNDRWNLRFIVVGGCLIVFVIVLIFLRKIKRSE